MTDPTYFIYLHRRDDTGDVFYVGKGTHTIKKQYQRAYVTKKRNKFWAAIVLKSGYSVELIADYFSEQDAFDAESELIARYGRRCDGGTLCNMTMGGEGHTGLPMSAETKAKMSARFSGAGHFNWGKKLSAETCRKKSESMKKSKFNLRGKKLPQWWKDRIAAKKCGADNPMFGRTGELHPNKRGVIDSNTGTIYPTTTAAAKANGFRMQTLHNMLTGFRANSTSMRFV